MASACARWRAAAPRISNWHWMRHTSRSLAGTAGCLRAQEGTISQIEHDTIAYHFHVPLGVVGQIIPWTFRLLTAAWKLGPALAAGKCVVLKPAEQTPMSIMVLMELIGDLLPDGVVNLVNGVNGFAIEADKSRATDKPIAKIALSGETTTISIRHSKALRCSRSIRARFAPARAAR